jgi:putative transposase
MNAASISVTKQFGFGLKRFGAKFAKEIRKKRAGQHSNWQWHLDEVFVKINGERFYLWRAVDH